MGKGIRTRFTHGSSGYDSGGYIKLNVFLDENKLLQDLNDEVLDYNTRQEIMQLAADLMDPYVPYLYGPLSTNIEVTNSYVKYLEPYSRRQFFGDDFNFTKDPHPLAQSRWSDVLKSGGEERQAFEEGVKQIILRRAKELHG